MSPDKLDEMLKNYRPLKARSAYLQDQLEELERKLILNRMMMIDEQVSLSQEITGMPHGTSTGDPTARLALDVASGKVSIFVRQIQDEIAATKRELGTIEPTLRIVGIVLQALSERECEVLEMRAMDEMEWPEIQEQMNREYNNVYCQRTLQRLFERAMEKAYEVVR